MSGQTRIVPANLAVGSTEDDARPVILGPESGIIAGFTR